VNPTSPYKSLLRDHQRERALLYSVLNTTDAMLVYLDPDFNFVWVNEAYARTCQRAPHELIGKNHFALYPHAENHAIFCAVRDTGESVHFRDKAFEFPDQPVRGVTYWNWSLVADKDERGQVVGLVLSLSETTAHVRAQQALRANERKLSLFIDGAPTGIAMFDRDMRFLAVSRRFLEDLRVTHLDVVGCSAYELFPEIPPHWRENHQRGLAGETLSCPEEAVVRADGRVHWDRWEIRPWFDAEDEIGGIILFTEDITARKLSEDALRVAKAEAEHANRAKSRFLAAASHDLRQPLAALSLYVGALENTLALTHGRVMEQMRLCVANLGEMLSGLLDLSKLEAGVVEAKVSDFSLDAVLRGLESTHAPEARRKGLRLRVRGSAYIGRTDVFLFQRIVGNLISNAIRYTERGGVLVACRRRQGKAWVEVWDTGIGVPADQTEVIFEEFKQLANEERNPSKGVGLGLAIVAKCAALLGLRIHVKSRGGKGSVFAVELPPGEEVVSKSQRQLHRHRPLRIAVLEDNAEVADALTCFLMASGHEVVVANACTTLMALLGEQSPDIVISDYGLGGGATGIDAVLSLRAKFGATLPAIIVTGDTDHDLIRTASERGLILHHKPLAIDVLNATLAELTNQEPSPCWLPESC